MLVCNRDWTPETRCLELVGGNHAGIREHVWCWFVVGRRSSVGYSTRVSASASASASANSDLTKLPQTSTRLIVVIPLGDDLIGGPRGMMHGAEVAGDVESGVGEECPQVPHPEHTLGRHVSIRGQGRRVTGSKMQIGFSMKNG